MEKSNVAKKNMMPSSMQSAWSGGSLTLQWTLDESVLNKGKKSEKIQIRFLSFKRFFFNWKGPAI